MSTYHINYGYQKHTILKPRRLAAIAGIVVVSAASYFAYGKLPQSTTATLSTPAQTVYAAPAAKQPVRLNTPMPWPGYGHAAYGVEHEGVVATSDQTAQPVPIASLAKVITAQAVLKQKPLAPGEQGPMITLTEEDVASFEEYVRKSGVVVPVEVGEQISQYQAMQAMLMTSANNMSDMLARWAFGSVENYTVFANKMVKDMGLQHTVISDASGFSPATTSTAEDMTQLGISYMKHPVLREIALRNEAQIPVAGTIRNYNSTINQDGIVGIKIGNTDEARRCFMAADIRNHNGSEQLSVAVVLGAEDLPTAMRDTRTVLTAGNTGYDQLSTR